MKDDKGYCICCGRLKTEIWKHLDKAEVKEQPNGRTFKEWEGHKRYLDNEHFADDYEYFYDNNTCEYCANCGEKLDDEDIKITFESRGECWGTQCSEEILTGYKYRNRGFFETACIVKRIRSDVKDTRI